MPWRAKNEVRNLREENSRLTIALAKTREQLKISERLQTGMRVALSRHSNRVTELTGKIEQLQARNKQLDLQTEILAHLVWITPAADATTPAAAEGAGA